MSRASSALRHTVETHVLERLAPPHVVVDGEGEIIYYSARTGVFLETPQGVPSRQILTLAMRSLRMDLRSALREARETRAAAVRERITMNDAGRGPVTLTVEPLAGGAGEDTHYIVFVTPKSAAADANHGKDREHDDSAWQIWNANFRTPRKVFIRRSKNTKPRLKSSNPQARTRRKVGPAFPVSVPTLLKSPAGQKT